MTSDDVRQMMRNEIERLGGQQQLLAQRMGVSQQYISDLLTKASGDPNVRARARLLHAQGAAHL